MSTLRQTPTADATTPQTIVDLFARLASLRWNDPLELGKLRHTVTTLANNPAVGRSDAEWMQTILDHYVSTLPQPPEWKTSPITAPSDTPSQPLSPSDLAWLQRLDGTPPSELSRKDAAHLGKLLAETADTADRPFVEAVSDPFVRQRTQTIAFANEHLAGQYPLRSVDPIIRDGFRDAIERTLTNEPALLDEHIPATRRDHTVYRSNVARELAKTTIDNAVASFDREPTRPPEPEPVADRAPADALRRGRARYQTQAETTAPLEQLTLRR